MLESLSSYKAVTLIIDQVREALQHTIGTHTHPGMHAHTCLQTVVSDIRTGLHSTQSPAPRSARSQLDNRWARQRQPTNLWHSPLTPPVWFFPLFVYDSVTVWTERETDSVRSHCLPQQCDWEPYRQHLRTGKWSSALWSVVNQQFR